YGFNRRILHHYAFVQLFFKVDQLFAFALQHLGNWYAGPAGYNLSHIFSFYFFLKHSASFLHLFHLILSFFNISFELVDGAVSQFGYFFVMPLALSLFSLISRRFNGLFQVTGFLDKLPLLIPLSLH